MADQHKFAIAACARWETRYIVEWLTYYRAIGFDHVYLYCNDDEPGALYERVLPFLQGPTPFVTFHYHAAQGEQAEMYLHFLRHGLAQCEWVGFYDIDEFLRLPPGETIGQFMARFPAADCVLFNWIFFGPNGHATPPEGTVLESLTRREAPIHQFTKYLARASILRGPKLADAGELHGLWHWPMGFVEGEFTVVNVLGEDMRDYTNMVDGGAGDAVARAFLNDPVRRDRLLATAMVHHYAFRWEGAFLERQARGLGGNFHGQPLWRKIAEGPNFRRALAGWNEVEDLSLADFWPRLRDRAWRHATDNRATWPISRQGRARLSSTAAGQAESALVPSPDGRAKFRTAAEHRPWLEIDLGGCATIRQISVVNAPDPPVGNAPGVALDVSIDGTAWVEIAAAAWPEPGQPLVWNGPGSAWARYVRVTLDGEGALALDQVEVLGSQPAAA